MLIRLSPDLMDVSLACGKDNLRCIKFWHFTGAWDWYLDVLVSRL